MRGARLEHPVIIIVVAAGMTGTGRPAQANIRIASSTTQVTLASTLSAAVAPGDGGGPRCQVRGAAR